MKLSVALLALLSAKALAEMPRTPCSKYHGASYGLCNAYCEAMECGTAIQHATEVACAKVEEKFLQIEGDGVDCGRCAAEGQPCVRDPDSFDQFGDCCNRLACEGVSGSATCT